MFYGCSEVNLNNLKLRKEALDKLDLPINVSEGYLGELKLVIPWSNLRGEPVKVLIDHVYLLAEPKNEATVTVKEEEKRAQDLKQRRLQTADALDAANAEPDNQKGNENEGFISQLTTKIVDNLQFTMRNIHIRYEDNISDPGHPFAAGITLKELSALSTDELWQPKFISESSNTINKLATLESLSVYWNTDSRSLAGLGHEEASQIYTDLIPTAIITPREHQYILKPVSGKGKIKLNKKYGGNVPKADVTLFFDELAFGLDDMQYRDAILMVDLFHANLKKQKYLKFHPEKGKTPKNNPKDYFQFAANAVLSEIHEQNYKWSWDHFKKRRDQRIEYIECYIAEKTNKATPEQKQRLSSLEWDLSFEDIRFYRSIAKSKIRREKIRIEKENEKKKVENANKGWFSSWFASSEPTDVDTSDTDSINMTLEQKKELYDVIEYDEDKASIASAVDLPKNTVKFALKAELQRGSFTLKQHIKTPKETDLISLVFEVVTIDVTKYIESMKIGAALGDLQLYDGATQGTLYHQLIGVKKENDSQSSLLNVANNFTEKDRRRSIILDSSLDYRKENPFFSIVFEKDPLESQANNAFSLKMRHLEIIYSPIVIAGILAFFKPPSSKMESVNALIEVAGDTFEGLKRQTKTGLEFALEAHTTIDLNIDMDAPIIIIPESLTSQDSPVMIIDSGHINVDSQLADEEVVSNIKSKEIKNYNNKDVEILEELMYDKFNLQLSQTKVLIGKNTRDCLQQLSDDTKPSGKDARLIERIDMQFLVEMCILPGSTEFTKFKISGHLPLLSVNISDEKYKILMGIVDFIVPSTDEQEKSPNLEEKPVIHRIGSGNENVISERFWGNRKDGVVLSDAESEQTSISSISRSDTPTSNMSAHMDRSQIEQFKLTFQVDKVSASISEASTTDPNKETLLCEILLESFELIVLTRPTDLLVDVSLNALSVIDRMEHADKSNYLITSHTIDQNAQCEHASEINLINVKYRKASREHPHFQSLYGGYDQTVDVVLSTLTVIVMRDSLLKLYDWIMNTFTAPPAVEATNNKNQIVNDNRSDTSQKRISAVSDFKSTSDAKAVAPSQNSNVNNTNRMKVAIHMDSIDLILHKNGIRFATGELSYGDLLILLEPNTLEVVGKFRNFTLSDDTPASENNLDESICDTYLISIVGDELADFVYKTYDPKEKSFPGYNQHFGLKMGAIHLNMTDSLKPTLDFLTEIIEMKSVYDAARNAAVETAQQYQEDGGRFHFDVIIRSPVVVFPIENNKQDTLVANLGEIRANNEFIKVSRRDVRNGFGLKELQVTHISSGLYDISLYSKTTIVDKNGKQRQRILPIIDDLDITFDIENPDDLKTSIGPASKIVGNISDVRMALTERQFKSLLGTWDFIQKTFLAPAPQTEPQVDGYGEEHVETLSFNSTASPARNSTQQVSHLQPTSKQNTTPKINMDLMIQLHTVCLEILNGEEQDLENREKQMLSRLTFADISLKMQTLSDESMVMEVFMLSTSFADIRQDSKSQFKEILPAKKLSGPQFQMKLLSYKNDEVPIMDIIITVDSPNIVLSLDFMFLLKDFFMSPFAADEPTEAQRFVQSHNNKNSEIYPHQVQNIDQMPVTKMRYKVNVVDLQVICLASPEKKESEAVILSFRQLTVGQDDNLEVNLDGIGMVLCRMDKQEESTMHFVEEFNVKLNIDNHMVNTPHNITNIKLKVEPIILRLSYQDSMLIVAIANKAIELMGNTTNKADQPPPRDSDSFDSNDLDQFLLANDDSSSHLVVPGSPSGSDSAAANNKPRCIEPYVVMSKENLLATFEGIQIVFIEDLHELPFLDIQVEPFAISAADWSRALQADVSFSLKGNYFNFKNSHWEPILEPWNFCIKTEQNPMDKSTNVQVQSDELLYINITHAFLESAMSLSETLAEVKPLSQTAHSQVRPYLIQNYTGYDISFWNMSSDSSYSDKDAHKIKSGESMPWIFRDWKKRREQRTTFGKNLVGVKIDQCNWESISNIALDKEGQRTYRLVPEFKEIAHRLVVEICLKNHVKTVTFRSGLVVENNSFSEMQVAIVDKNRRILSGINTLKTNEVYHVPIRLCYSYWVVVRPSDQFRWSKEMLAWSDVMLPNTPKSVECPPNDSQKLSYKYQINPDFDKKNPIAVQYPFMKLQFCAPIQFENLLPFDFRLTLTDLNTDEVLVSNIPTGETIQFHTIKNNADLMLSIKLNSEKYKESFPVHIHAPPNYNSIGEKIIIQDDDDVPTILRMNITRSTSATDSLWVSVFAPYIILNKSGLPITVRAYQSYNGGFRHTKWPIESIPAYKEGEIMEPAIFSYPEIDHHNRAQITINESKWSEAISFEAVGNTQDVTIFSKSDSYARHAGIMVQEGTGTLRLSKIVTITPRYIIKNNMSIDLKFCEFGFVDDATEIKSQEKMTLYHTSKLHIRWLCLQLSGFDEAWSSPVDIQQIGKSFVKVDKGNAEIPYLVRISVHMKDSTIFVTFNEDKDWPFWIVNESSVEIQFIQENIGLDDYNLKDKQKKALRKPRLFSLSPKEKFCYSWDIPVAKEKRIQLRVGERRRSINFQAIGSKVPFRYNKRRDDQGNENTLSLDIAAVGPALVLRITDYNRNKSLFQPKSSASSTLASTSIEGSMREAFEAVNIQHVINFVFNLNLAGVGVSIINKQVQELAFITVKGLDFKYTDSNLYQSIRLSIQWLQIDNQLYGSTYPILCFPSTLPKVTSELETHPTLHVSLDKVKDDYHGVICFKLFSILLQEMSFEIDEDFLYALLDFCRFSTTKEQTEDIKSIFTMTVAEPSVDKAQAIYYFEEFCIQPMRLNLSFVRTEEIDNTEANDTPQNKGSAIDYVFNVFTMTLGNINDAPIKLNALLIENLRASSEDLVSHIIPHYKEQIIYQIHRVLGSIDILGNPVGLFNTLSSGFGELFYEPYQGFIMSDRPQDLGIGIAKGVGGFMKKSVFGVTDSMSRFTGSLGKGISAATMDKNFQDRRRINMTRNKPTHAMYGVTQGVGYFGTSVASGVVGLVKRPLEGAESGGVVGFMGGIGKGLVGVVTKPVVGFFDMASNITAGIRETTTVFQDGDINRERLPRFIGRNGIVIPFSQREALGQIWLKGAESGKFFYETYVAHNIIDSDETIAILTYQNILVLSTDDMKLEYLIPLDTIESCEHDIDGVYLHLKKIRTRVLSIEEETSRKWFATMITETLEERNREKQRQ
ncbi:hypothetical protein K501DRAFT_332624 [Backusella circina FSU 941]|nr:hypothetical protein K501DRAFT_332624 [Backusella circina FSU 941]